MLRMSFLEHLEELRTRIIRMLMGLGVAFLFALVFAGKLWDIISEPAVIALQHLHVNPPRLAMIQPMEGFSIIWVKLPLLCSIFLASPWILYQLWAFIAPGLYKRERKWATPFILITAGLFIGGGLFAYFIAFRYGLEFLLGISTMNNVQPVVSITEYFDLFVNVTLGVGLVFEMPVLIFLLTVLRLASPRFLLKHSPTEDRAMYIAAGTAVAGLVGGVTSVASGGVLSLLGPGHVAILGLSFSGFHALFFASVLMRWATIIYVRRIREPHARGAKDMAAALIVASPLRLVGLPLSRLMMPGDRQEQPRRRAA